MNKRIIFLLGLILVIAFSLRVYHLKSRGIFEHDEIRYYSATIETGNNISQYITNKTNESFTHALLPMTDVFAAKPGHVLLGLASFYLMGAKNYNFILGMVLWGLLTILLLFWIGYKLYNLEVGLIAALLLAISALHIDLSRSYMAHVDQCFFVLLATYLYILAKTSRGKIWMSHSLAGLCLGFAFIIHPQANIYFTLFVLYEILGYFMEKQKALSKKIFYTGILIIAAFIPIFTIELISLLGKGNSNIVLMLIGLSNSYFGQLAWVFKQTKLMAIAAGNGLEHKHLIIGLIQSEGFLFSAFAFLSAIFLIRRIFLYKKLTDFVVLTQSAVLFFYWQLFSSREHILRYILNTLPFFCIAIGTMFYDVGQLYKNTKHDLYWRKLKTVLIILLFIEGIWFSAKVINSQKTPYPAIEDFILTNKIDKILSTSDYLPTKKYLLTPNLVNTEIISLGEWKNLQEEFLKDKVKYIIFFPDSWLKYEMYRYKCKPIAIIPRNNPSAKSITIYKVQDILDDMAKED